MSPCHHLSVCHCFRKTSVVLDQSPAQWPQLSLTIFEKSLFPDKVTFCAFIAFHGTQFNSAPCLRPGLSRVTAATFCLLGRRHQLPCHEEAQWLCGEAPLEGNGGPLTSSPDLAPQRRLVSSEGAVWTHQRDKHSPLQVRQTDLVAAQPSTQTSHSPAQQMAVFCCKQPSYVGINNRHSILESRS